MLFIKLMKSSDLCIKKAQCLLANNPKLCILHTGVFHINKKNAHLLKANWEGSRGCSKYD